jgi:hypothetical protein
MHDLKRMFGFHNAELFIHWTHLELRVLIYCLLVLLFISNIGRLECAWYSLSYHFIPHSAYETADYHCACDRYLTPQQQHVCSEISAEETQEALEREWP